MTQVPVRLVFSDVDGHKVATMTIYPDGTFTPETNSLVVLATEAAEEYAEAPIQLQEMSLYEYELEQPGYRLKPIPGIVKSSNTTGLLDRGRITPGLNVGRLRFSLLGDTKEVDIFNNDGLELAAAEVEVRTAKVGYREDYRYMLKYITDQCTDLLLEFRSPVQQQLIPDDTREPETLCQRFAFIRSLLTSREFRDAIQRIVAQPHRFWEQESCTVPITRGVKPTTSIVRQIASTSRRVPLPAEHSLASHLSSVPQHISINRNVETTDTAENRFVKHAIRTFLAFTTSIHQRLKEAKRDSDLRFVNEALALEEELSELLNRGFFREISEPRLLPLGSPVLQRKGGYREILAAWLQFDMAARLCWNGGMDVYGAGKRDVATLYEYWLFFKLLDIVADIFKLEQPRAESLIEETSDGFGLMLKPGKHIALDGEYKADGEGRKLKIQYSYNRTFMREGCDMEKNFPVAGSWTERMRPDYTLTLWPSDFTETEAEEQEIIVHVHFDAKYRVKDLADIFGERDEIFRDNASRIADLSKEKTAQKEGSYLRADLLKMHAYKDAIRRTAGAYVLYPGTENRNWQGFHEIVPGLGAFGIRPVEEGEDGTAELKTFILQVVKHVCDRATQRERETYHRYDIHKIPPADFEVKEIPERYGSTKERHAPAADTTVILGFIRKTAEDICREKGVFYFHAVDEHDEPVAFDPRVLKADYFLPYSAAFKWLGWFAAVENCELITKSALEEITGQGVLKHTGSYYYLMRLNKHTLVHLTDIPTLPPPNPGEPRTCMWCELYP